VCECGWECAMKYFKHVPWHSLFTSYLFAGELILKMKVYPLWYLS
jgi:hypothetical protein